MPREGVAFPVPNILGFIVFCRVIMGDKRRHKKTLASFGMQGFSLLVEEDGFEPSKSTTTDLQSAPFGHSGTPPYAIDAFQTDDGAGGRIRTPDLLITNQLLYQLSYTSVEMASHRHFFYYSN